MNTRMIATGLQKYVLSAVLAGSVLVGLTSQAVAVNTLSAGSINGTAGGPAVVPITASVGSAMVVNLGATFTVVAQGGAPAITTVTYTKDAAISQPDLVDNTSVPGSVAIGYVSNITPTLTGTVQIGTVTIQIPAGATGSYQVQVNNVSALDPDGNDIAVTGMAGTISLASAGPTLTAGSINGTAGQPAVVPITASVGSAMVVNLGATFTVVAQGGAPAITTVAYTKDAAISQPDLVDNTSVPGSVAIGYVSNIVPTLTGTVQIGTVTIQIPTGSTGSYQVQVNNVSALDPDGNDIAITGQPGTIQVGPVGEATDTPTVTATVAPTNTPTNTVVQNTNTPTPTSTATRTATITPTRTATKPAATATPTATATSGAAQETSGGCEIGASGTGSSAWLLLIPAVGLLVMRRRSR